MRHIRKRRASPDRAVAGRTDADYDGSRVDEARDAGAEADAWEALEILDEDIVVVDGQELASRPAPFGGRNRDWRT